MQHVAPTRTTEPWDSLLETGRADERLVHEDRHASAPAAPGRDPGELTGRSPRRSSGAGIEQLYAHQAEALHQAFDGPTIVTTGTASGKSLCFQLPTLEVLTSDPGARALYLYPTKALAQDQARVARRASACTSRSARRSTTATRPRPERSAIRKRSNLIITNPDMLHVGILPHHAAWGDLFANLAFVVVDEAHVYRGRVRLPCRQRAAAAAPGRGDPRHRAALPAGQRDDRQPARARRDADRAAPLQPRRPRRRAPGGAPDRHVEPAAARRGARRPGLRALRGGRGLLGAHPAAARGRSAS